MITPIASYLQSRAWDRIISNFNLYSWVSTKSPRIIVFCNDLYNNVNYLFVDYRWTLKPNKHAIGFVVFYYCLPVRATTSRSLVDFDSMSTHCHFENPTRIGHRIQPIMYCFYSVLFWRNLMEHFLQSYCYYLCSSYIPCRLTGVQCTSCFPILTITHISLCSLIVHSTPLYAFTLTTNLVPPCVLVDFLSYIMNPPMFSMIDYP